MIFFKPRTKTSEDLSGPSSCRTQSMPGAGLTEVTIIGVLSAFEADFGLSKETKLYLGIFAKEGRWRKDGVIGSSFTMGVSKARSNTARVGTRRTEQRAKTKVALVV